MKTKSARASSSRQRPPLHPPKYQRFVELLADQVRGQGFSPSRLAGVKFMRSTMEVPRTQVSYEPSIVIVAQGRKSGYLAGKKFVYDANHFLVLAMPLPFECETEGSEDEPLLGLSIGVTPALVAELLMHVEQPPLNSASPQAIQSSELDDRLGDAATRLVECLRHADDARILGPQIVREITYRVLNGPLGHNLRALAAPHSHFGQIGRVMTKLNTDYARTHDLPTLASEAGMSVSTFHAHFKSVTSFSPLQYLKNVRLHKARMLMVHEGINASSAAMEVGYESASQFSREFKRLFGDSPANVAQQLRKTLIRLS
ncbi:AraC family transcriptional regulator [Brevifollis gellanilyticus]|uniref:AraC family transcriptional regulator n=1 Tax=Brevifollis gellanilyticus TaxID=748831 RepID=A0A512MGV0_9BACT|nr:AraC family transcriptional regulator [Brevifollis gellanilyticus]GEP45954.1 AraC family transcriptional regulator [Brevifollis gellanilyticus]